MPRPTADDALRIEARQVPALSGCVGLRWGDIATATLARDDSDVVELVYRWCSETGGPWRETGQTIRLVYLACHFGGQQRFFACPSCQRRAIKLYHHPAGMDGFACRHCGRLVPRAQSEGSWQRALRRASKLRRYCGDDADASLPFPPKPRQMRWATYRALREEALMLESLPASAWLASGTANIRLAVRRGTMGASKRRWWPARNAESRAERRPG